MKCPEREQLFAFAHRLLEARDQADVQAHVEACPQCRQVVTGYHDLDHVLDEWKPAGPSPWFEARVRQSIESLQLRTTWGAWFATRWVRGLALASLAVLVGVGVLVVRRANRPSVVHEPVAQQGSSQAPPLPSQEAAKVQPPAASPPQHRREVVAQPVIQTADKGSSVDEDLQALEDYDMIANFDVLSDLPKGKGKVAN